MRGRRIEVDGRSYVWRVGRRHVAVRTPAGVEHAPEIPEVLRTDGARLRDAQARLGRIVPVRPADVRAWIQDRLHGGDDDGHA